MENERNEEWEAWVDETQPQVIEDETYLAYLRWFYTERLSH